MFEMVERALNETHLELGQIDLYATANGPGSFTGIRVGLAAARAWGKVFDRPVRGVSVFEAMMDSACQPRNQKPIPLAGREDVAENRTGERFPASHGSPRPDWFFPILDARRGEFYVGTFRKVTQAAAGGATVSDGRIPERARYEPADEGRVLKPDLLRAFLDDRRTLGGSATCLVRAHDQAATSWCAHLTAGLDWQQVEGALVESIARVAREEEQSGQPLLDAKLDAYYLRRTDAEANLKD